MASLAGIVRALEDRALTLLDRRDGDERPAETAARLLDLALQYRAERREIHVDRIADGVEPVLAEIADRFGPDPAAAVAEMRGEGVVQSAGGDGTPGSSAAAPMNSPDTGGGAAPASRRRSRSEVRIAQALAGVPDPARIREDGIPRTPPEPAESIAARAEADPAGLAAEAIRWQREHPTKGGAAS